MTSVWEVVFCSHGDNWVNEGSRSYFSTEEKAEENARYWNERFDQKCRDRGLQPWGRYEGWCEVREIVLDEDEVT